MNTRQLSMALVTFVLCAGGTSSLAMAPTTFNPPDDEHTTKTTEKTTEAKETSKESTKDAKEAKDTKETTPATSTTKKTKKSETKTDSADKPASGEGKSESKAEGKGEAKSEGKGEKAKAEKTEGKGEKAEAKSEGESKTEGAMTADKALAMLQEGNARWVSGTPNNPASEPSRRAILAEQGQKPVATVLTCSDSRMPVERIFDRGVGDVFVVRVAGNVGGVDETGSIEYGVGHLKTPLLVVMGHTKCGAVAAAASGAAVHGKVQDLVSHINPAVDRAKRNNPGVAEKDSPAIAVRENVWQSIYDLMKNSPEIREAVASKEVKVVGAVCDISNGKVEWLGEHPWQSEILEAMNQKAPGATHAEATEEKH